MPTLSMEQIAEMSKTVYAWCAARTENEADAEDLSQDVLIGMMAALPNLKNQEAFYGFTWSVARNVYRQWLRKKRQQLPESNLEEGLAAVELPEGAEESEAICLLRRELSLLHLRYRQAAILYYVQGLPIAQVAKRLSIGESMAKYLLFKARNRLREGMDMERNYGEQSYNPRRLQLRHWGQGPNWHYGMADTLLRQNILFACYYDALSAEQIALSVGVGLPYMEDDLQQLFEAGLLRKDRAGKYRTGVILFTKDFKTRVAHQAATESRQIADLVKAFVTGKEREIRSLGFVGADLNGAAYAWQIAAMLLYRGVIDLAGEKIAPALPQDPSGLHYLSWGVEEEETSDPFAFGISRAENTRGDRIQFMDFSIHGEMVHRHLNQQAAANVFLAIARGEDGMLPENDAAAAAEMVRRGFVRREAGRLRVCCPVFTGAQYGALIDRIDDTANEIAQIAWKLHGKITEVLQEHTPKHLKDDTAAIAYFHLFDEGISGPVARLHAEHFLPDGKAVDCLPTTYVILKQP